MFIAFDATENRFIAAYYKLEDVLYYKYNDKPFFWCYTATESVKP